MISFNHDKVSKFNKAMMMYILTHNKQNNVDNKEVKDEKNQQLFIEDLSQFLNDKDSNYKAEFTQFSE